MFEKEVYSTRFLQNNLKDPDLLQETIQRKEEATLIVLYYPFAAV